MVAVVAIGAALCVKFYNESNSNDPGKTGVYDTSKPDNQESAIDPKKDTDNAKRQNAAANQSTSNSASTSSATPQITYFGQNNGMVILDATVSGATNGVCTATFKNGSASVIKTTNVVLVTSYYACGEFQVTEGEFSPPGAWSATVRLNSGPESSPVQANVK